MAAASADQLREPTILDMVVTDHRNALALLDKFEQASSSQDRIGMENTLNAISMEILMHSVAEESVLYPFIEERMGEQGKEFSEHSLREHKKLEKDLLEALQARTEGGHELMDVVKQFRKHFEHHLKDEEQDFFPKLVQQASEEELTQLGPQFIQAKTQAPVEPRAEP
ncbi:hypothetical protein N2152v2_004778 [Parachlorella kessleri]